MEEQSFRGWKDDFLIEVAPSNEGATRITVRRTVLGIPGFRACRFHQMCQRRRYEPEVSNGRIEDWLLTEVATELKQP